MGPLARLAEPLLFSLSRCRGAECRQSWRRFGIPGQCADVAGPGADLGPHSEVYVGEDGKVPADHARDDEQQRLDEALLPFEMQ